MKGGHLAAAAALALALAVAGCGSSNARSGGASAGGTVSVLYAGSLADMMERDLGPAFAGATGYRYEGVGAGSTELVSQIKGKVRRGDVFISASPKANAGLEGAAGGGYVRWYATFAKAPLAIGYDPRSRFASQFRSKPWYRVIAEPGIRVGATDPKLDPKGRLTVAAIQRAATALAMPSLMSALSRFEVFPEESLVGRMQAGQLDAGFFYSNEASEQHIPTVSLDPVRSSATYTVTVLAGAPNPRGAQAFVSFLLGAAGRTILTSHGLTLVRPTLSGSPAAVPRSLQPLLARAW